MAQRHTPLGYCIRNGNAVIEPITAAIVRNIFIDYQNGKSTYQIAETLGGQGILNASHKPKWYHGSIGKILENRIYLGDDFYPILIEPELFHSAQERREAQRKDLGRLVHPNSFAAQNVFLGKVYCGICGQPYRKYMEHCNQPGKKSRWKCKQYIKDHTVHCRNIPLLDEQIQDAFIRSAGLLMNKPDLLEGKKLNEKKEPVWPVLKLEREIQQCNESEEYQAEEMVRLIYERAKVQYQASVIHDSFYQTEKLKTAFAEYGIQEEFQPDFYRKVVKKMVVQEDGIIQTIFINGVSLGIRVIANQEGRESNGQSRNCCKEKYSGHTGKAGV